MRHRPTQHAVGCAPDVEGRNDEFLRLQYQQALETYRAQLTLLVQIITVLVLADVTMVGFAINSATSGMIVVGAVFPVMILIIISYVFRLSAPILYVAVNIEEKFPSISADLLASTFVSSVIGSEYLHNLRAIVATLDPEERIRMRRELPAPIFRVRRISRTKTALMLITLAQLLAPIPLYYLFCWHLL